MTQETDSVTKIVPIEAQEFAQDILQKVGQKMYGMDGIIRYCLIALYTNGHVLLEGNPGLGKTELVKTLSEVLNLPYGRIQFTPDLMPSDITGTYMPKLFDDEADEQPDPSQQNHNQSLKFRPGPVFTHLLLADEINRATPKTQSAMLEAMAERQVTVLGITHRLNAPFFVLATQNPIDHEGTYDLPEAQADRFMFKLDMPVPVAKTLVEIMKKETERRKEEAEPIGNGNYSLQKYQQLVLSIQGVEPRPAVQQHICNIVQASNQLFHELDGLKRGQDGRVRDMAKRFRYGLGPRAAITLMKAAKAWSLLFSTEFDPKTHLRSVAEVAIPTLRHRVKLQYGWEQLYTQNKPHPWPSDGVQKEDLLERMIADFCLATAPNEDGYFQEVEDVFNNVFATRKR